MSWIDQQNGQHHQHQEPQQQRAPSSPPGDSCLSALFPLPPPFFLTATPRSLCSPKTATARQRHSHGS
ncbi:unnamed protein product [Vitrella brassicaformis CCMP3155]|uniref:Uncharacterized protein n=1 Tax=Vitrella brassicaformis (strain CCMP3155) TaxID=1169540 RepID=A0A0G4EQ61_VITBC|nr:unnamed protein product [Vitrella brassicaformis CCMP3155]|eukprot:CEL99569.1 unnamed protein product [Vitrella brassicaformis CCMP3155]